jgi:hypothetical protein
MINEKSSANGIEIPVSPSARSNAVAHTAGLDDSQTARVGTEVQNSDDDAVIELSLVEMWESCLVWEPFSDAVPEPLLEFLDLCASIYEAVDVIRHCVQLSEDGVNIKAGFEELRELAVAMAEAGAALGDYREIIVR